MKIAVIGQVHPYRSGIAHSTTVLCANLSKRHNVRVYSFSRLYPRWLYPGKAQRTARTHSLRFPVLETLDCLNPFTWLGTARAIKVWKPDVVIIQWWTIFFTLLTLLLRLLLKGHTHRICYCQNVLPHETNWYNQPLTKLAIAGMDSYITLAGSEQQVLSRLLPHARSLVLIEPTYEMNFGTVPTRKTARKKLGISGDVVLFFGFVRPYKGLDYLLRAMPSVLKKRKVTLLVVGEFWEGKAEAVNIIRTHHMEDAVTIIDSYVSDDEVPTYFKAADVCVLPYASATQSGIIQVAFAYDLPCIITDVGGLPDFIRHGDSGILVPPKNEKAITRAILTYFERKQRRALIMGIRKEKVRFAWSREKERILFHGLGKKEI